MKTQAYATLARETNPAQRIDRRINLDPLPARRVESGRRVFGTILGLIGGLMVLGATGILFGEFSPWSLLAPFAWVGIAILLSGVHLTIMGKVVTLDAEQVAVRTRGLLGRKAWEEPLGAYRGVMLRSKWVAAGRDQHAYQVFLVELQHEDPKKTVAIFESRRDRGWHATWREMSIRFRLTALEETPEGVVTLTPGDLEKSVREKFREGTIHIAFDPSEPAPPGLSVQAVDGGLDIRVLQRNWRSPTLLSGIAMLLVGGIMVAVLIPHGIPLPVIVGLLAISVAAAAVTVVGFFVTQPRLRVGREAVSASLMTPLGQIRKQVIHPAQINGVQIGAPKGQQGGTALHILTDDGRVYFGAGLSRPAQEWLRNCLLAAVARL